MKFICTRDCDPKCTIDTHTDDPSDPPLGCPFQVHLMDVPWVVVE